MQIFGPTFLNHLMSELLMPISIQYGFIVFSNPANVGKMIVSTYVFVR